MRDRHHHHHLCLWGIYITASTSKDVDLCLAGVHVLTDIFLNPCIENRAKEKVLNLLPNCPYNPIFIYWTLCTKLEQTPMHIHTYMYANMDT